MAVPEESKENLRRKAYDVLCLRQDVALWNERVKTSRAKWEKENESLFATEAMAEGRVSEAEQILREMTISAYGLTGDKRPGPGVEVKEYTVLSYPEKDALDWAKLHQVGLKLDKKVFEKVAEAERPSFVIIKTEPRAIIASDLEKALANQEGN